MTSTTEPRTFASFAEFYPFYLDEHKNRTSRRLHFVGTTVGSVLLLTAILSMNAWFLLAGLVAGYAFAWVGHFFFEKNRPATFKYPFYSFVGDYAMYRDIWRGKIPF
ncbi:Mpo1-like protein [Ramlibacter sp.]|uniref:Mpo1-like protein n=1 Tax=Ramlibacter sp. TaxID=1917967 RepID=UPI003D10CD60